MKEDHVRRRLTTILWIGAAAVLSVPVVAWWLDARDLSRLNAHRSDVACGQALRAAAIGLLNYAADHDDRMPAVRWMDAVRPYVADSQVFRCPRRSEPRSYGHVLHRAWLGSGSWDLRRSATVLLFDGSDTSWNATGDLDGLADPPRHGDVDYCIFADLHVRYLVPRRRRQ